MKALLLHSQTHRSVQLRHHHQSHSLYISHSSISSICAIFKHSHPQQTSHVQFCECCVFHQRLTQHFHPIITNTVVCPQKQTQHDISLTSSSKPMLLSNANTLHRSSVVRLVLLIISVMMCLILFPLIPLPVHSRSSCSSWHPNTHFARFVVVCSYLSDKAHLTFCSSSEPCTVMPLVVCPLVCLFSHVPNSSQVIQNTQ